MAVVQLFMAVAALSLPLLAQPSQAQGKHTRIELLAERCEKNPGLLIGVHFILEKGWHIYWINPGDSGQPPAFTWHLPSGFTAGEVLWPRPQRLQASPSIADYGYANEVLLTLPLRAPASWNGGSPVEVAVNARWLICREVCIPDDAELKLTASAAASGNPATERIFAETRKLLPNSWPKAWKASVESRKDDFVLTIETGKPIRAAEFFPLDPGQIENVARQRVEPTRGGVRLVLRKSDLLLKPVSHLRGVLVIAGRGAYELRAPVARGTIK